MQKQIFNLLTLALSLTLLSAVKLKASSNERAETTKTVSKPVQKSTLSVLMQKHFLKQNFIQEIVNNFYPKIFFINFQQIQTAKQKLPENSSFQIILHSKSSHFHKIIFQILKMKKWNCLRLKFPIYNIVEFRKCLQKHEADNLFKIKRPQLKRGAWHLSPKEFASYLEAWADVYLHSTNSLTVENPVYRPLTKEEKRQFIEDAFKCAQHFSLSSSCLSLATELVIVDCSNN